MKEKKIMDQQLPNLKPLSWRTEKRQLNTLVPLERNPFGKINAKNKKRLEEKIQRLGVFETATVDSDGILLTWNKRYAILMELGRGEEFFDVSVPNRPLTATERKEIILSSNIHEGNWIQEILGEDFADLDVAALGLDLPSLDEVLEESAAKVKSEEPVYPVVAQFSEKHDAFIIVSDNEIDTNHLKEILQLGKEKSYKCDAVGQTHVIRAKDLISLWKSKS